MRLDDRLVSAFADSFLGYGDYAAPYWLVGMEEGGGVSLAEVQRRLSAWDERGRRELDDLPVYARLAGEGRWFTSHPPLQPTWSKLIRLVLRAEGRSASLDDVRRFQRDELGRSGGATALLELLPLPSPSANVWHYGAWSDLPELADRASYEAFYAPRRAEHLRRRVREHRPRAVVFYGKGHRPWWERIVGSSFVEDRDSGAPRATREGTTFVLMPHPTAMGVTNASFEKVGRSLGGIAHPTGAGRDEGRTHSGAAQMRPEERSADGRSGGRAAARDAKHLTPPSMSEEQIVAALVVHGFIVQKDKNDPKREARGWSNYKGDRPLRLAHPASGGRGSLYVAPDFVSATGKFRDLADAAPPSGYNRPDTKSPYPQWESRELRNLLAAIEERYS